MESKLNSMTLKGIDLHCYPFNRTSMESKLDEVLEVAAETFTFNRTSMESKRGIRRDFGALNISF